ncbi:MAG TPA: hypothetical protein DCX60_01600, partial [Phycisphaerales bacterium]|nr:hypothetical protein [Phycisphaerales bacterium]
MKFDAVDQQPASPRGRLDGMTAPPLARDIDWLNARLDESTASNARDDIKTIRSNIRVDSKDIGQGPDLSELSLERIDGILKLLTMRFHLRNKSEQLHITRVNRERELESTQESPRPESLAEAIRTLRMQGTSLEEVLDILSKLDIQPTLTAHPTESRRRSIIAKQDRIAELLTIRNGGDLTRNEENDLESGVRQTLAQLMATDEIRSRRLDVI